MFHKCCTKKAVKERGKEENVWEDMENTDNLVYFSFPLLFIVEYRTPYSSHKMLSKTINTTSEDKKCNVEIFILIELNTKYFVLFFDRIWYSGARNLAPWLKVFRLNWPSPSWKKRTSSLKLRWALRLFIFRNSVVWWFMLVTTVTKLRL